MASHSSSSTWKYEVFLNFRSEDTRKGFTGHLYNGLENKGIHTFIDNKKIQIGEEITPALVKAIQQSRISIPIFSKNYACSKYCLLELAKILQCYETKKQIVLPIFIDVEPSDVRKQTGSFGEAFREHEKKVKQEILREWKVALQKVGKLAGWVLKNVDGDESKLVKLVVGRVLSELNKTIILAVADHPIGLDSRVEYVLSLMRVGHTNPLFVGICGMGGIGKTTIATAVRNRIFRSFEGASFIADVRERGSTNMNLVGLQKQLLRDILGEEININYVYEGSSLIQERLRRKKVLLILDDVDQDSQLTALAGGNSWFSPGSMIIITTRDKQVLRVGQVNGNNVYNPEGLDNNQSLQLFSMHAFGRDQPFEDYMQLSKKVVRYAGGLPLTLKVLGRFLNDVRGKEKWESALQKLKKFPPTEVLNKLKISYIGLEYEERAIFLDIACFFIGMNKNIATYIWEGCGYEPKIELEVLIRKSLVTIGDQNELRMHDQLRDMGRRLVYEESREEPGKRSRLWSHEEALAVLTGRKGTPAIKSIRLNFPGKCFCYIMDMYFPDRCCKVEDFTTMPELRFLILQGVHIDKENLEKNIEHLPSSLQWFCWQNCCLEEIPSNFYLEKLLVLDLEGSFIQKAWNTNFQSKRFENLKLLNLSYCRRLRMSPDFSSFPQLEILTLKGCMALIDVHESMVQLKQLVYLDLGGCSNLKKLPCGSWTLHSLQEFILSDCSCLEELPDEICDLKSLIELQLIGTPIKQLPMSIGNLKSLVKLELSKTKIKELPESIGDLKFLEELNLEETLIHKLPKSIGMLSKLRCLLISHNQHLLTELALLFGLTEKLELPESIGDLESLVELKLHVPVIELPNSIGKLSTMRCLSLSSPNGSITRIPESIESITSLVDLNLEYIDMEEIPDAFRLLEKLERVLIKDCRRLKSIPMLPSSLSSLAVERCESLERLPDLSNLKKLRRLCLQRCKKLSEIQGIEGAESLEDLDVCGCFNLITTKMLVQGDFNNQLFSSCEIHPSYGISNNEINKEMKLCLVFELEEEDEMDLVEPLRLYGIIRIKAHILRNGKRITCRNELVIDLQRFQKTHGEIMCIQHFQGLKWFAFPLKQKDEIEIVKIFWAYRPSVEPKYVMVSSKDKEQNITTGASGGVWRRMQFSMTNSLIEQLSLEEMEGTEYKQAANGRRRQGGFMLSTSTISPPFHIRRPICCEENGLWRPLWRHSGCPVDIHRSPHRWKCLDHSSSKDRSGKRV